MNLLIPAYVFSKEALNVESILSSTKTCKFLSQRARFFELFASCFFTFSCIVLYVQIKLELIKRQEKRKRTKCIVGSFSCTCSPLDRQTGETKGKLVAMRQLLPVANLHRLYPPSIHNKSINFVSMAKKQLLNNNNNNHNKSFRILCQLSRTKL